MQTNSNFDYTPHLKKAYIDPIRTVTIIDDEYPTIDELISSNKQEFVPENINRLQEIIKISRSEQYNWLLDVYNGKENKIQNGKVTNRLHHSDLLILDYHLDGEDSGYCKKSIDIIKNLSDNRHFNIVAVHTKGYTGAKGTVQDVLIDIIVSLQKKPDFLTISDKELSDINDIIDEWEIEEDGITDKFLEAISTLDLLYLINKNNGKLNNPNFTHPYLQRFELLYQEKPSSININKPKLLKWLSVRKLELYNDCFSSQTSPCFEWGVQDNINWIRTEDLFLTVLGKKDIPISDIPSQLLQAISDSRPHPHKLILSKLRHEIESNGSYAASNILNKKFLQAAWLKELLKESNSNTEIKTSAWQAVTKLWEELAYEIKDGLDEFTINLVNSLKSMDAPLDYFIERETLDNETSQAIHANCFSCSKKISTHHLVTGHILSFRNNYWLCLTPMCDLVPGQKDTSNKLISVTLVQMYDARIALTNSRENMRKALELESIPVLSKQDEIKHILKYSTQNNLLFIRDHNKKDDVKILSFTFGLDGKANPKAMDYYVENQGIFENDTNKVKLRYAEPGNTENDIIVKDIDAEVVAELRYEYALNLLGKLGVSKSRVGLDFIN
ncbi:response regulator receiver domain [Enterobacter hormaechei]|uniref:response regulator receiver domain n=1 Tax=Enterobacter hormaechei TaxID=158836 RepID=UPI002A753B3F|nr:response regulator receiver domain [Enterobacter hormaechei]MDY3570547.1 response regulator receiver domain [Enterobacter hormaechei]